MTGQEWYKALVIEILRTDYPTVYPSMTSREIQNLMFEHLLKIARKVANNA